MASNPANLPKLFELAITNHQAGNLAEAERHYRTILQISPRQFDALHYLGVLQAQRERYEDAVTLIKRALKIKPHSAEALINYGNILRLTGRPDEALVACDKALALAPDHVEALTNRGAALQALGRYAEALASYDRALALNPRSATALNNRGVVMKDLRRFEDALASFDAALAIRPSNAEAHCNRGNVLRELGRAEQALASYDQALAIRPSYPEALMNRGDTLQALHRTEDALVDFRQALLLKPDYAEAHYNLGRLFNQLGKFDDAITSYRRALALKLDFVEAHNSLGNALQALRKFDDAVASYRRALSIKPDYADAHYNLGNALRDSGQVDDAIASYRNAVSFRPDFAAAHYNLGDAFRGQGRLDESIASLHKALAIKPDYADAANNLGLVLHKQGNLDDAVANYRRALSLKPDFAKAHFNLGLALHEQCLLDDAIASYRQALSCNPDYVDAHVNLGNVLRDQVKPDAAIACFRKALSIRPDHDIAYSNLLFLNSYHVLLDPQEYLTAARGWELACVSAPERAAARSRVFKRPPLAGRRLKVGYVSGDFRQHAVSYFAEPLFRFHSRDRIELYAYSTHGQHDEVTAQLESAAEHWVPLVGLSDNAMRDRIDADGIDVLIDLAGHTAHNRLGVFARRAAPVQAHYLGFFASTGLTEIDYWIGDEILTPAETDSHFSEKVWRLPRSWVNYDGGDAAPLPDWRPAADGTVWLGSFNYVNKLTPATLSQWAKVLHALPEGRLLLKTRQLADTGNRQRILDALSAHGIASDRVELQDGSATHGWAAHMAYYDRLDIALDPVGAVGGGTTTCDALWMGVPLVTLAGERMASRMTVSMVNAIGHGEWVAQSETEYVDKVVALARNVELRKNLRTNQRSKMALSPLCNSQDMATQLENAYFKMFERWLNGNNERHAAAE